jgi:hypothetical protein
LHVFHREEAEFCLCVEQHIVVAEEVFGQQVLRKGIPLLVQWLIDKFVASTYSA